MDGHGHHHLHDLPSHHGPLITLRLSTGVRRLMISVVAGLAVLTVTGLVLLWPESGSIQQKVELSVYNDVSFVDATVRALEVKRCSGTSADRLPDGDIPDQVDCPQARVGLPPAPGRPSEVTVVVPALVVRAGLEEGDEIRLTRYPGRGGEQDLYAYNDRSRQTPLVLTVLGFVLAIVSIARLRGLAAIAGLAGAYAVIGWFVIPGLRAGENPAVIALVAASAIMIVTLFLAHGFTAKTTAALLGTISGLALTAVLAVAMTEFVHLDGLSSEEDYTLSQLTTGAGLQGIVLCGIIIASLGVLNDVTITQASAVWELRHLAPHLGVRELFTSGMRIGRDHLASTVYTMAFAFAGASLPTLLLINLYGQPLGDILVGADISEEIVSTAVGSVGLVLTIPLTTMIAALLVGNARVVKAGASDGAVGPVPPSASTSSHSDRARPRGRHRQ